MEIMSINAVTMMNGMAAERLWRGANSLKRGSVGERASGDGSGGDRSLADGALVDDALVDCALVDGSVGE
jgi:hypothetical protein